MASSTPLQSKCVAILLGTGHGGDRYLLQQLQSYAKQTYANWRLYVSDDASSDDTLAVIERFKSCAQQPVVVMAGPRQGFAANFLSLAKNPIIQGDCFAFSDQDDIWHADKLERAMAWLAKIPDDVPALYFSRTDLVEANGTPLGRSKLFTRPPSFQNALVQNIGGGNTMVFNRATKQLLEAVDGDITSHDWATYQLVTAVGGRTKYDPIPSLAYRQHASNILGANQHMVGRIRRIQMLFSGQLAQWTETNIGMLLPFLPYMTSTNRKSLEFFAKARVGPLPVRLYNLKRSGVYRQTLIGNLGLLTAAIFRRF